LEKKNLRPANRRGNAVVGFKADKKNSKRRLMVSLIKRGKTGEGKSEAIKKVRHREKNMNALLGKRKKDQEGGLGSGDFLKEGGGTCNFEKKGKTGKGQTR